MIGDLGKAIDIYVDSTKPVKLVDAHEGRKVLNLWAGVDFDIWYASSPSFRAGTIGHKVEAGKTVEITNPSEIWVLTLAPNAGLCGYSEEF